MTSRLPYGPNDAALLRHGRLRDLYMEIAERRHNSPESRARWEAMALDRDGFCDAIKRDMARLAG